MKGLLLPLIAALLVSACSDKPKNFQECITHYVKPGIGEEGTALITDSCREQFPEPDRSRPLTFEELSRITGRASPTTDGRYFRGSLYNGNKSIDARGVIVRLHYKQGNDESFRDIRITYDIAPLSTSSFSESILPEPGFQSWEIIEAKGAPLE